MIRKLIYTILPAFLLLTACKKQLDINNDPNNPLTVSVAKILPTVERGLGDALTTGSGISQILGVYTHQFSTRENPDQYGATGTDIVGWDQMYGNSPNNNSVLSNAEVIISEATKDGNLQYAGIAKVIKAYAYSQLVDVYGDVPFSEASQLAAGIISPKFDKGADIYPALFTLLDGAIADLSSTTALNLLKPGTDDVIYNGNIDRWIRTAKTIKLKLLVQQRRIKNVTADVTALLTGDQLIRETAGSFLLPYGVNGATDDRNPGFGDYYATQRGQNISPWFYEILKGYNTRIYTAIPDPRVPYYFFNQLTRTQVAENEQPTEYRDGGFVSIYFGSIGEDRDRTQQNNSTLVGIYPVGGRYDDGRGKAGTSTGKVTAADATGAAPYRFITYADRLYLEAELISSGVIAGDARAVLLAAMNESFKQIDYVITTYVKPSQTVPAISGTAAQTTYVNAILQQFDTKPLQQLESIMTQKWISSFGSAVDQYTDYRRTGFPVLFNPKDATMAPGGFVQPPINGNIALPGAQKPVPVQLNRNFPLTLPWYTPELETNTNAPAQKSDPSTFKPFWLP